MKKPIEDKYLNEEKNLTDNDVERVVDKASAAFWKVVAQSFPEIKSGDFDPGETIKMEDQMVQWVKKWYEWNIEQEEDDGVMYDVCNDYSLDPVEPGTMKNFKEGDYIKKKTPYGLLYIHKKYKEIHYLKGKKGMTGKHIPYGD